MSIILVNVIGLLLMAIIIWWFFIAKPKATQATQDTIDVLVQNGVYEPSVIQSQAKRTLQLNFIRKDDSPCSEYVIFETLNISEQLPLNQSKVISINLTEKGEYEFTCQMGMYRGKILVS